MRAMDQWLKGACRLAVVALVVGCSAAMAAEVGKYRMFETEVTNTKAYGNKFADVELTVTYTAPSGKEWRSGGSLTATARGGGDATTGDVWKMRFMPDEVGTWNYTYAWSDGTEGGNGSFECTEANAGKGIIKAYEENPHWFAYNGTEPVWLKSYYETGHGGDRAGFRLDERERVRADGGSGIQPHPGQLADVVVLFRAVLPGRAGAFDAGPGAV